MSTILRTSDRSSADYRDLGSPFVRRREPLSRRALYFFIIDFRLWPSSGDWLDSFRFRDERVLALHEFSVRLTMSRIYFLSPLFMTIVREFFRWDRTKNLLLKRQSRPYNAEDCCHFFVPNKYKPFCITSAAVKQIGMVTIMGCLYVVQAAARKHNGLDSLQVFESPNKKQVLWFYQSDSDGGITVLVPADKHLIREDK